VDLATQTIQTHTVSEIERTEKFASEFIKQESAALKAEVFQRLRDYAPTDAIVQRLDEQGQKRADELRDGIEQNTSSLARLAADQGALRSDLQRFSERLETMPMALAVDFATERDRLNHEVDDRVAVRLREFADAIRQEVSAVEELKVDRGHVDTEINSLADRMAHIEGAIEQATTGVRLELSSIKTELSQQQSQLQPAAALLQNVEETLRTKIAAIQDYLAHEQQSFRTRDLQQREFETQLQRLAQRLRETESTVQQTHALMINETAQAAQQREGLMTELITLRTQLGDAPARYAVMDRFEENLQAKFRDLQNQLAQNAATVDRRDSELRDLKAQVQSLIEQVARAETGLASSEFSMAERVPESPAVSLELITTNAPPLENRPSMVASRLAAAARGAHRLAGGEGPRDLLVEGEDPVKSLQERMSADIERARAELREKSGRWKVRR
jgi:chromosome segregation ATPase